MPLEAMIADVKEWWVLAGASWSFAVRRTKSGRVLQVAVLFAAKARISDRRRQ
jgi:hypothetical protein